MTRQNGDFSPQMFARGAGALYMVVIIVGVIAELVVRGRLVVVGDAVTTAQNIMTHEALYRIGFAAELLGYLVNVPLMMILYVLFRVVNRPVALTVLFFSMIGTTIGAVNLLNALVPLKLLGGAEYLSALPVEQLWAQAHLALRVFQLGFSLCLTFFAFFCLFQGYLIYKSGFMPKLIGILLSVQGACYFLNSMINFLAPSWSGIAFMVLGVSVIGELSFSFWLLLKGIDVRKWHLWADSKPLTS